MRNIVRIDIYVDTEDNNLLNDIARFVIGLKGMLSKVVKIDYGILKEESE